MMAVVDGSVRPPAIFLMGPTASGKTDLAMALADRFPVELISVDSALVYKGMDIGSAKPDAETLSKYPHRLIDIRDPAEPYSAADFRKDALQAMQEITESGRIPLLVGGTMLYFKALLEGLSELPKADPVVRAEITAEAEEKGWPAIHERLQSVDPETAERLKPTDSQRLQRALEVYMLTGQPLSVWHQKQSVVDEGSSVAQGGGFPYNPLQLAIVPANRSVLHERIAKRFQVMLNHGLVEEVRALYERGDLDESLPSIRAVGYRQVWHFLQGQLSLEEMQERGVIATRQLAKRQLTWLRGWPDLQCLDGDMQVLIEQASRVINAHLH